MVRWARIMVECGYMGLDGIGCKVVEGQSHLSNRLPYMLGGEGRGGVCSVKGRKKGEWREYEDGISL